MAQIPDAVQLAEGLLALVKQAYAEPDPNIDAKTHAWITYKTKIQAQHVASDILRELMGPMEYTSVIAQQCQESAALNFVTSLEISDHVGDGVKSVGELSTATGVDPTSLSVALNCISARGFFEETEFGSQKYRNTELSRITSSKHATPLKDTIGLATDDAFRAASYFTEAAKASTSGRRLPAHAAAYNYNSTIFEWMATPEQAWRGQRVGRAMMQSHSFANQYVAEDFPWSTLPSPIVDLGGGIGSLEVLLLKHEDNRSLSFTVFDIPKTVETAIKDWTNRPPEIASCVSFVGGSFLDSDPSTNNIPQNEPTYIIRHVLWDWSDAEVVDILCNVRVAMDADGQAHAAGRKLFLCEMLLDKRPRQYARQTSMQLLVLNNGFIRTEAHMIRLLTDAGFAAGEVHHMRAIDSIISATVP